MASRKEQKERIRLERQARERAAREAERHKRLITYAAASALAAAAVVAVIIVLLANGGSGGGGDLLPDGGEVPAQRVTDLNAAATAAGCKRASTLARSAQHKPDSERIVYTTNPPAAGDQYEEPTKDGAYQEAPPDGNVVHATEHSRVAIWFKPTLPTKARAELKAMFDQDGYQQVLLPRRRMPYAVAATAWNREPGQNGTGRLLGCPRFSPAALDAIRAFRDEHRGNGPESVP